MAFVNHAANEVNLFFVYWGAASSGRSSCVELHGLQFVDDRLDVQVVPVQRQNGLRNHDGDIDRTHGQRL